MSEQIKEFLRTVILGRQPCDYGKDRAALDRLAAEAHALLDALSAPEPEGWLEIDDAYSQALEFSCTCGSVHFDGSCAHCSAWESARAKLKRALAAAPATDKE